ncbi:MAG: T9SS type A sorting domain-containing protein [Cryomorphaceae bacterium]|nr:T9SS type A sorting domain-containing protein [Cryomorphaceae bacterium]
MKTKILSLMAILAFLFTGAQINAEEIKGLKKDNRKSIKRTMNELCSPARAQIDLDLNNVRARVLAAGDMWWNLSGQARYEVPKGSNRHSMFSGALWLGGIDEGSQLKLAAMTYRQRGNDFWPGPLTDDGTASVTSQTCQEYDRFWMIDREQVEIHRAWLNCQIDPNCDLATQFPGYEIPVVIRDWPGNGIRGYDAPLPFKLAPFEDQDGDGLYDPEFDYPGFDLDRQYDCRLKEIDVLYGDRTIWWVYNDRGNVHTESQAGALGFEIRAQAFAFSTNDEINNMTFYNYRILNKSTFSLTNAFFGTWFDPDLGDPRDDLIGCDIPRGLGYCYNAELFDGPHPNGYGANPPAIGLDFFQGPFADYFDGLDNDKDGCIDAVRDSAGICIPENPDLGINERIIMSGFMYYNNSWPNQAMTNPEFGAHFYNFLQSKWKNNNLLMFTHSGGRGSTNNGTGFSTDNSGIRTLFAFPGQTYDTTASGRATEGLFDYGTFPPFEPWPNGGWYESPANLADKRGLHCAGPFTLQPGALNFITTGAVWARDFINPDPYASVELLKVADDKAQNLFDNCFQILDGPDAPLVEVVELDNELILKLSYPETSNNYNFGYRQIDPLIVNQPDWDEDPVRIDSARQAGYFEYKFEGIQIFQFRNASVTSADLYNPDLSRLVYQVDIENEHGQLINYERAPDLNNAFIPQDMTIQSENKGIRTTFRLNEDLFSDEVDRTLVNHREYYYFVIAYAVNQFREFDPVEPDLSQQTPYLAGRRNAFGGSNTIVTAIPHKTEPERNGLDLHSRYGDSPEITRIAGIGNMGSWLELTEVSEEAILRNGRVDEITYRQNAGPVNIKVVNPKRVRPGDFSLRFIGDIEPAPADNRLRPNSRWVLEGTYENEDGETVVLGSSADNLQGGIHSDTTIAFNNEQIISEIGLSVNITNVPLPGEDEECEYDAGVIGSSVTFTPANRPWLMGVTSDNSFTPINWILAGTNTNTQDNTANRTYQDRIDDPCDLWNLVNRTWAPYGIVSRLRIREDNNNFSQGFGPGFGQSAWQTAQSLMNSRSVDIVITADHTKWTRVPVFEMNDEAAQTGNGYATTQSADGILKHRLRTAPGWDLSSDGKLVRSNQNPGWSYFPGYAIDIESGERLNMAFGENTWLKSENGDDMLWNPTANLFRRFDISMGGMHYLYVFRPIAQIGANLIDNTYKGNSPANHPLYQFLQDNNNISHLLNFWGAVQYVHVPLLSPGFPNVNPYEDIPAEVRFKLRFNRPYSRYNTSSGINDGKPYYEFSTRNIAAGIGNMVTANEALDLIGVVPNPYFAFSMYENSQLDNIVKIINLPERCNVNIFSTAGTLIRTFRKDNTDTYLLWDLTNDVGVPITSGVYIIHVDAGEIGQKVVKWFGAMRPIDLNAF